MISASLLSMRDNLFHYIKILNKENIDYIHIDMMDGVFVPNKSFTYEEIKFIIDNINRPIDVHLMVKDIDNYIKDYLMYDTEYITIHYEAMIDLKPIAKIKSHGIKCGISIKPDTNVEHIYDLLDKIDLVLIMSVEPGKGGQEFIPNTLDKISKLKDEIKRRKLNVKISVDGGITEKAGKQSLKRGADMLVIGSALKKDMNIINKLKLV
jgi:ribulose-phosphate 3-epimerase